MTAEAPTAPTLTKARIGPVAADPYPWPYDGGVDTANIALVCIDWQVDFCGPGGYVDRMGYDIGLTRAGLPAPRRLLEHARSLGMLVDPHPRGARARPVGPAARTSGGARGSIGAEIGSSRPVRADPRPRRAGLGDRARGRAGRRAR